MSLSTPFIVLSIVYSIFLNIIFRVKGHVNNSQLRIYEHLLILNLAGLFAELGCIVTLQSLGINSMVTILINKLYLVYLVTFVMHFLDYVYSFSIGEENYSIQRKSITIFMWGLFLIYTLVIYLLPIDFHVDTAIYSYGPAVNFVYVLATIGMLLCFLLIIKNIRNVKKNNYFPVIFFILASGGITVIQKIFPELTLMTTMETFILFIIYMTIENPDIRMVNLLEIERDRADKANQAKTDFLSSMSHEIRTPLNAICGFSEMISQSTTLEDAKDNAKDIISASETLLETVNGILDISKIESGKIELVESDYNPNKMLEETVKLARGRLGDKPLDFQVNIAPDIPKVLYGDKFNIKKILINFLTNAIKYTDEGFVRFDVQCVKLNGMVRLIFIVSDSGRGIKKEDINKLFTKFQRLDEEKNQTIEGTGLGLAITKQLIDMMKGTVVVDSVYGEGSKFTFCLDQKISDATLDDTTQSMDIVVDMTGKKVLVVDDNKLNLKVADKLLKLYNLSVTLSNSGSECLDLINDGNKYDLILLDDMMPQMSGTETLAHLKDIHEFNTPVVALTANAINGMKEKYLEAGFDGYLAKPIVRKELYITLVKFLNPSATYESDKDAKVMPEEEKEDSKPTIKADNPTEILDVSKVNEAIKEEKEKNTKVPQYVPDNIEIVVKPGNSQKVEKSEEKEEEDKKDESNSNKVVLIVDDNNLNIKVESKLITSLGYKVESANSGIEAINIVKNKKYDLIFMDIMMPMMDGVKTLHELQKLQGFNTPVVALTADAVLGAKEKYLAEGFDLYVTKPANKEDFDKIIKKFVSQDEESQR